MVISVLSMLWSCVNGHSLTQRTHIVGIPTVGARAWENLRRSGRPVQWYGDSMSNISPNGAPEKRALWQRLLPAVGGIALVVILFGWVLPQFIDYEAVFRSIGDIDGLEWAILVLIAMARFVPEGAIYLAAQPGLSITQGIKLFLVSETLSNVPPGGLDLVSRYQMTRSWGFEPSSATSATIASWIFASLSKLILPIAAVAFLWLRRVSDETVELIAVVAFFAVVAGIAGIAVVVRSERLAARAGSILGWLIRRAAGVFRKEVRTDFTTLVIEFRDQASVVLRTRTWLGVAIGIASRLAAYAVLLLAARFVGLDAEALPWEFIFAGYAVVMALTVIPIFSMPGLTEVVLISALTAAAADGSGDAVAAAVFVYRILTWLTPIPFGGFVFSGWRKEVAAAGQMDLLDAFGTTEAA